MLLVPGPGLWWAMGKASWRRGLEELKDFFQNPRREWVSDFSSKREMPRGDSCLGHPKASDTRHGRTLRVARSTGD